MKYRSPLAIAALTGLVAAGSLAATLSVASPALADEHHGTYTSRDNRFDRDRHDSRDRVPDRRDDRRGYAPAYVYQRPAYDYVPAYRYPAYAPPPSNGYVRIAAPGFSVGFGF